MFEHIVIRRSGNSHAVLDVGLLAETLLFYQKAHLLIDPGSLAYLIDALGEENLRRLLNLPFVTASFQRNITGTYTDRGPGFAVHNFVVMTGHGKGKTLKDREYLVEMVERKLGSSRKAKKFAQYLFDTMPFTPLDERPEPKNDLLRAAADDLADEEFLREGVRDTITILAPSIQLPPTWAFRAHFIGSEIAGQPQFVIQTDLDFEQLNAYYHQFIPASHSSLSPENLVTHFLSAREAAFVSTRYMAELVIDPVSAALMRKKLFHLMRKRDAQVEELDLFQQITLQNAKKLREVVNAGERSFGEFLDLLDEAARFKQFLESQNPDKKLIEAYIAEITKVGWLDKMPTKTTRLSITTGLGIAAETLFPTGGAGMLMSLGIGAFDALAVDKLLKGWRPNRFIDDKFIPFVSGR